jgi:hypothetical protein
MKLSTPDKLLAEIEAGRIPPVILVGGNNEYLAAQAYTAIKSAIAERPGVTVESFSEGADLGQVIDSFRTHSLFAGARLLCVPDVNAFVSKKELSSLLGKALEEWKSAKTDRKRATSLSKLLHVLGLVGIDVDETDSRIASAIGAPAGDATLGAMLGLARATGKKASRGEGDAALLAEAATRGGAPGATLLLRTGEIPGDSATVQAIERAGVLVERNLSREHFVEAFSEAVQEIAHEQNVVFEPAALAALRKRLGIERLLADKFSKDIPDLRAAISEAERLATLVGGGGRVTQRVVEQQIGEVGGGARYEFGSLFAEGEFVAAVAKLRELVAQSKREDSKMPLDMHYGKFIFPLADEVRQLIAIRGYARVRKLDLRRNVTYNQFRDSIAEPLGDYLKEMGLVRQRPHPFALHKKWAGARRFSDEILLQTLFELAELDFSRKSGGVGAEIGLEAIVLSRELQKV